MSRQHPFIYLALNYATKCAGLAQNRGAIKKVLAGLLVCCCWQGIQAQDSGQIRLLKQNLYRCGWLDRIGERDSSLFLLEQTLRQANTLGDVGLIADARMSLIRHFARYQLRDSLESNLGPLIGFSEKNGLPKIQVEALLYKAAHLLETQRYREAMQFCELANEKARPLAEKRLEGLCLLHKGSVLRTSQNDSKAPLNYYYQAFKILEEANDTANIIRTALLISSGEEDKAKKQEMLRRAESLSKVYPSETTRMSLLNFKAAYLSPAESLPLLWEALSISRKLRIPNMVQHLFLQLSTRYQALKQYDRAIVCMDSARAAFPNNLPDDGALHYYGIYKEMGDFGKAVTAMERFRQYEDERKQMDMKSLVAEWETKLNTHEKEWELKQRQKELKNERTRNLMLGIILLLALAAGGSALWAFFKQRKGRKQLALQNETIQQQSEEIKSMEKLKSRFFTNVSHELRTPLTLILGPVNSLLKRKEAATEETKLLQLVQRNAQHLQQLINEILDLAKLEDNKLEVVEEPVHLYLYLKDLMTQFYSASASHQLGFGFDFKVEESLQIGLDKSKFEKIVHNFFSNAIKFTPKGGKITLSVIEADGQLQLSVADTGRGIHPNDLPHVFDRFYQTQQPDAPTEGGTGIGLSLVKELGELLDGQVWVESELGKGSTFYFKFPKKTATTIEKGELKIAKGELRIENYPVYPNAPTSNPPSISTILIVEDNQDLRDYLQFLLSDYNVLTAENGQAALDLLMDEGRGTRDEMQDPLIPHPSSLIPDLIISDLMMPVMDGFQFLEKLKSDDRWRHLPVIMLTAKVNIRAKLKALRIGVDDYLTKPFEEDELKARIENLLHNYRERMEMFSQSKNETPGLPTPDRPVIAAVDAEWLQEVEAVFTKHLADRRLNVDFAANKMNLSERQFHRRLKQLTGLTPNQYLQEICLQRAKDLLLEGRFATIKETAFAVGFHDARYFSDLFERRFGVKPSAFQH